MRGGSVLDGVHDLGGMEGFGRVRPEPDEPVFHADWERHVWGMNFAALPGHGIDEARHLIEQMGAVAYLTTPYYGRWLHRLEARAVLHGVTTAGELEALRARHAEEVARLGAAAALAALSRAGGPGAERDAEALISAVQAPAGPLPRIEPGAARFAPGDRVRVLPPAPGGHTRRPRYVRGATGVVERLHGLQPLPDAGVRGERVDEVLYSVAFRAAELWPADPGEGRPGNGLDHTVRLDLWESYLEPAS